jgi:hypothetical protein
MRTTLGRIGLKVSSLWYALAEAVGGFIEEGAFRVSLATCVLLGKSPKTVEKRAWDKDLEVPTLLDFFDWTTDRHLFSVLVWPSLEVPEDSSFQAQEERTQQVKQVIMRGAAEKAWATRVEVTYGLAWESRRQAWVAPDDFGYVPVSEKDGRVEESSTLGPSSLEREQSTGA